MEVKKKASIHSYWLKKHLREYSLQIGYSPLILDVGCANLPYKSLFDFGRYIAIDIKNNNGGMNILGGVCSLPIKENAIDAVVCTEVLEHIKDTAKAVQELNRVLKKGGYLILSTPLLMGEHELVDFFRFTELCLHNYLEEGGFKVLRIRKRGGIFSSIGSIISHIPGEIFGDSRNCNYEIQNKKKQLDNILFSFLSIVFIIASKIFIALDVLDHKKYFTLGYELLCIKEVEKNE